MHFYYKKKFNLRDNECDRSHINNIIITFFKCFFIECLKFDTAICKASISLLSQEAEPRDKRGQFAPLTPSKKYLVLLVLQESFGWLWKKQNNTSRKTKNYTA